MNQSLNSLEKLEKLKYEFTEFLFKKHHPYEFRKKLSKDSIEVYLDTAYNLALSDALKARPKKRKPYDCIGEKYSEWNDGIDTYESNITKLMKSVK